MARSPLGELLARRGTESIAGGEEHRLALRLEEARELGDRGRLARAVHAGEQDHERLRKMFGEARLERGEQRDQGGLELRLELGAGLEALVALRLAQPRDELVRRGHADVGGDELRFELSIEGLVDLRPAAQDAERALPPRARELDVLAQEGEYGGHGAGVVGRTRGGKRNILRYDRPTMTALRRSSSTTSAGRRSAPAGRNRVRIIAGKWRSRQVRFPPAAQLRPTPDRVRETLFNWLGQRLDGLACLDLFAGSGALGFEAASRGAVRVVLVENDRAAARALELVAPRLNAGARVYVESAAPIEATRPWRALREDRAGAVRYGLYEFAP